MKTRNSFGSDELFGFEKNSTPLSVPPTIIVSGSATGWDTGLFIASGAVAISFNKCCWSIDEFQETLFNYGINLHNLFSCFTPLCTP